MSKKMAIIDLGSNTSRMLIIEVTDRGAYHLAEEDKGVVRLSEDMLPGGDIKRPAFKRAAQAMKLFKGVCDNHNVTKVIAVATAAVREATNQKEFLDFLASDAGIEFKVLSRQEEPYYGYLGVINTVDLRDGIIMDMGGGSTEITLVKDRKMVNSTSIPYGALNLTEKFLDNDKPKDSQLKDLEAFVRQKLSEIPWLASCQGMQLIGIGGTMRSIARINQRMVDYQFDELHNYFMDPSEVSTVYGRLKGMSVKERMGVPGLSKDRADIILAGVLAISTVIKFLKVPVIRVSSSGLRDGLFFHDHLSEPIVNDITTFSLENVSRLYRVDEAHAWHVMELSRGLFEELKDEGRLKGDEWRILRAAALLHEVGYYYDFGKRYNNTFYNILDNPIYGFTHMENYKTALVAAHFGAGGIKGRSVFFETHLNKDAMRAIRKLSVILALADALDRSRKGLVKSVKCHNSLNSIELEPAHNGDILIEALSVEELSVFFKKAFDKDLIVSS
ncbi:MAG TPA: Ppx/GppA phosphatase family protein [Methanocellaceae archaeon]